MRQRNVSHYFSTDVPANRSESLHNKVKDEGLQVMRALKVPIVPLHYSAVMLEMILRTGAIHVLRARMLLHIPTIRDNL